MGIIGVNAFKGRMTLRFRLRSYYQKIILLCLVLVLLLSIIQSCVSFFLLRRQAISRSDALSEQIVHSLGVDQHAQRFLLLPLGKNGRARACADG